MSAVVLHRETFEVLSELGERQESETEPVNNRHDSIVNRLSDLQRAILRYLLHRYQHIEAHGNEFCRRETSYWGVPWRPFGDDSPSATERAAMSRALRRLELRGLVQRRNKHTGDRYMERPMFVERPPVTRTLSVKLSDEGRRLAKRLDAVGET